MTNQEIKKFIADYLFEQMEFSHDEDFKDSVVGEFEAIDVHCALAGGGGIYTMRGKSGWFNYCRPVPKKVTCDMTSLKKERDELKKELEFRSSLRNIRNIVNTHPDESIISKIEVYGGPWEERIVWKERGNE